MIKGFSGTTLIDFPGRIASIVFIGGCNFRCPFCHNPELVLPDMIEYLPEINQDEVIEELKKRKGFIQGVTITGGEPLVWDRLIDFLREIKSLGLEIKIDTNGSFPERLKELKNLADYVAMDIKSSPSKYHLATGIDIDLDKLKESIAIVKTFRDYEFRTTVVPGFVDQEDIHEIGETIKGAKRYVLQQFKPTKAIDPNTLSIIPYTLERLEEFREIIKGHVDQVLIRSY